MTQNLTPGATIAQVGSVFAAQSVGAAYTATTGSITTSTSTVTTGNIGLAGNVTVYIYGTYAGVTVNFEVSPDNTNWFTWPMQREQTGAIEASPVLASNTAASWTIDAPGFSFFRVRASAWTSGTANVVINPGSYPITPVVSNISRIDTGRTNWAMHMAAQVAATTTDTLMSFTGWKGNAAVAATTTPAVVTTGKTLRLQAVQMTAIATATAGTVMATLRANTGGLVAIGSPVVVRWQVGSPAAVAGVADSMIIPLEDGFEFPAGTGLGVSIQGFGPTGTASGNNWFQMSMHGFEY